MATELYEPIDTPKPIAPDVWIVDGPIVRLDFRPVGQVPFPTRMTVIRLSNGDLFCHSPTQLSPGLAGQIGQFGTVRHLISPNWMHYAHIPAWKDAFPAATAWASPGVERRMKRQGVAFAFDASLTDGQPKPWAEEIDQFVFEGSFLLREIVFFHRRSRTLILTDLVQNHEPDKLSRTKRWVARFGGALYPDGTTPLDLRLTFLGHRRQVRENLERIVIAHGKGYESGGGEALERIFRWVPRMPF